MAEHKVQWLQNVKAITVSWITDGGAGGGVESQQRIHIQILLLLFGYQSSYLPFCWNWQILTPLRVDGTDSSSQSGCFKGLFEASQPEVLISLTSKVNKGRLKRKKANFLSTYPAMKLNRPPWELGSSFSE